MCLLRLFYTLYVIHMYFLPFVLIKLWFFFCCFNCMIEQQIGPCSNVPCDVGVVSAWGAHWAELHDVFSSLAYCADSTGAHTGRMRALCCFTCTAGEWCQGDPLKLISLTDAVGLP